MYNNAHQPISLYIGIATVSHWPLLCQFCFRSTINMSVKRTILTMKRKRQVQVHITLTIDMNLFRIQDYARAKLNLRISTKVAKQIRQAPANAFLSTGRKRNRKVLLSAFEATFFESYRRNDGKAILTDDLLLEKGRSIRAAKGISENDLRLSNGWLHKFKSRHHIQQHELHGESDLVDRAQSQWIKWSLTIFATKCN